MEDSQTNFSFLPGYDFSRFHSGCHDFSKILLVSYVDGFIFQMLTKYIRTIYSFSNDLPLLSKRFALRGHVQGVRFVGPLVRNDKEVAHAILNYFNETGWVDLLVVRGSSLVAKKDKRAKREGR